MKNHLTINQYLSEVSDQINEAFKLNNLYLVSPPGSGKTTFILNNIEGKRILALPTTAALQSIQANYDVSVYYEKEKDVSKDTIITTYSSLRSLVSTLELNKKSTKDYMFILDEAHTLVTSYGFRSKDINYIVESFNRWSKTIIMTGTPIDLSMVKQLPNFHSIVVKNSSKLKTRAMVVQYSDLFNSLINRLTGGLNVIFLNNKQEDGDLGELLKRLELQGIESNQIQLLNSDLKETEDYQEVVKKHYIKEGVRVLITTSLLTEALDINTVPQSVHIASQIDHTLIEQFVNRFRKGTERVCIYKKMSKDANNVAYGGRFKERYDFNGMAAKEVEVAGNIAHYVNSLNDTVTETDYLGLLSKGSSLKIINGKLEVDVLGILNMLLDRRTQFNYNNIELLKKELTEYGWEFLKDSRDNGKTSYEIKEIVAETIKEAALNKLKERAELLKNFSDNDFDVKYKERSNEEFIQERLKVVKRVFSDLGVCKELVLESLDNRKKWGILVKQLRFGSNLLSRSWSQDLVVTINKLKEESTEGLSKGNLLSKVAEIITKYYGKQVLDGSNEDDLMEFASLIFDIKVTRKGKARVSTYNVTISRNLNLIIDQSNKVKTISDSELEEIKDLFWELKNI